jgi:hypothetical protein
MPRTRDSAAGPSLASSRSIDLGVARRGELHAH